MREKAILAAGFVDEWVARNSDHRHPSLDGRDLSFQFLLDFYFRTSPPPLRGRVPCSFGPVNDKGYRLTTLDATQVEATAVVDVGDKVVGPLSIGLHEISSLVVQV